MNILGYKRMTKEALKFFQAYIDEMIKIGGKNLPKSISTSLGVKMGKLFKSKGIKDYASGLTQIYTVLKGTPKITNLSDNSFEVEVVYDENFCPIGGAYNSEKAPIFQACICSPYTNGFLKALHPTFTFKGQIEECILNTNNNKCKYKFAWEESGRKATPTP